MKLGTLSISFAMIAFFVIGITLSFITRDTRSTFEKEQDKILSIALEKGVFSDEYLTACIDFANMCFIGQNNINTSSKVVKEKEFRETFSEELNKINNLWSKYSGIFWIVVLGPILIFTLKKLNWIA